MNYPFFKYLSSIIDEEEQIAEIVLLSFDSIQKGIEQAKEGLASQNIELVKAGFHLMRPNLIHIELPQFAEEFPASNQADFFDATQALLTRLEPAINKIKQVNHIQSEI